MRAPAFIQPHRIDGDVAADMSLLMHAGQLRHQLAQQALDAGLRHASGSGGRNSAQRAMRERRGACKRTAGMLGSGEKRHSSMTKAKNGSDNRILCL
ncbi:Uncharacterised protein [Bordetella pertussis]|nr:Uncharacterised protein [Bordetella pertussis]